MRESRGKADIPVLDDAEICAPFSFAATAHAAIADCLNQHGFAVVRRLLDEPLLERLKQGVRAATAGAGLNKEWGSRTCMNFVEQSEEALLLLAHQPYMDLIAALHGTDDLCFHRSACIARAQGEGVVRWHTDQSRLAEGQQPCSANEVLNQPHPDFNGFSAWFYLTGSRPSHGGIHVIQGSHKEDWQPPQGFVASACGRSFHRVDGPQEWYQGFDVEGCVPVLSEPGDLILFDANTYHAAESNTEATLRLSAALGLRPRRAHIECPWAWPEAAQKFAQRLPEQYQKYLDGYTSIVADWCPNHN